MPDKTMRSRARRSVFGFMAVATAGIVACGGNGGGVGGPAGNGGGAGDTATGGDVGRGGMANSGGASGSSSGGASSGGVSTGGVIGTGGRSTTSSGGGARGGAVGSGGAVSAGGTSNSGGAAGGTGTCVPNYSCKPTSPNTGDIYADCVARVNQFRACVCLPPLSRWSAGESCADQDAKYDAEKNSAHAGFIAGICSGGNAQDECPGWGGSAESIISGCLQMMFDEGPPPTANCTGTCYSDHGHYINMTGTKYKSGVACGFYTTSSGDIWAVQNFQ